MAKKLIFCSACVASLLCITPKTAFANTLLHEAKKQHQPEESSLKKSIAGFIQANTTMLKIATGAITTFIGARLIEGAISDAINKKDFNFLVSNLSFGSLLIVTGIIGMGWGGHVIYTDITTNEKNNIKDPQKSRR